jgi:hypothetical protein
MAITVAGPLGIGETSFEIDVRRALPLTWLLSAGGVVLTVAALAWQRHRRRQRRTGVAAVAALALTGLFVTAPDAQTFDRARYRAQSIAALVRDHPAEPGMVVVREVPIRTAGLYSGAFRPLSSESRQLLTRWTEVTGIDVDSLFRQELRVDEGGTAHWLPVQDTLVSHMTSELKSEDAIELFLVYVGQVGGRHLLLVNAFSHGGHTPPARSAPAR